MYNLYVFYKYSRKSVKIIFVIIFYFFWEKVENFNLKLNNLLVIVICICNE